MKKLLTAVIAASMLMPIATLASSTRPGSSFKTYPVLFEPAWCIGEEEEFDRECDIVINEDGVTTPDGHIIDVKQWIMTGEKYDIGKGIVGGAAGTAAGLGLGMATCGLMLPVCLFTLPAMTGLGAGVGGNAAGANSKFFTVLGNDKDGEALILEFKYRNPNFARKVMKELYRTTSLAMGQLKS